MFKLANLVELYQSRMQRLGVKLDTTVDSTRLKQRHLAQFPDMRAHTNGRDVLLIFEEGVGDALTKACELYSDNDVVHLARAAQTVRRHIFEEGEPFNGFTEGCQEDDVPSLLLALVIMVLECPNIPTLRIRWQTPPLPHLPLPDAEVDLYRPQPGTSHHMTRNCQAQCCTGDPSSDTRSDDIARSYTKEGVSRQVVTPGHEHLIYPRS